jgi:hypothetical protein
MSEQSRKEDYFVRATLANKDKKLTGIPCKIFLPERIYEKPSIFFQPENSTDATLLMSFHDGKFTAEVAGLDQKLQTSIFAKSVYISQSGTRYWGADLAEPYAHGEPQHLMIVDHFASPTLLEKTEIVLWITPNDLLTPSIVSTHSYTGEIKLERLNTVDFLLKDGVRLVFDRNFKTKNLASGDLVQWSFLVAHAEITTAATNFEELQSTILPIIDDFLLIASLAEGRRTACLGWTATDKHSHAIYHRGNFAFPDCNIEKRIHDGLPDRQREKEFVETCYANFLACENQMALRGAICAAVPMAEHTIEAEFLSRFAGLETLLLAFRRQESLEHILPAEDWRKLKKTLESSIKASTEPRLDSNQRSSLYSKLEELNRFSIREAFDIFCRNYRIFLSDLWPVFGDKDAIGLVDIRNKLIHGDPFPGELVGALGLASIHLRITLERALVRVLGWDIGNTKVAPAYLGAYFKSDFLTERKRLTDYINS